MIISRTPLRVGLAGGGTDIRDHYGTGYGPDVNGELRLTRKLNIRNTFLLWLHESRYFG
jgi:hypothetical protein